MLRSENVFHAWLECWQLETVPRHPSTQGGFLWVRGAVAD